MDADRKSDRSAYILRTIVEGTAGTTGSEFFRSLVRHLASALGLRYCLLSECVDSPSSRVRVLAFWKGDGWGESFEYDLEGTPCRGVLGGEICRIGSDVQTLFPSDRDLVELDAESYTGLPLTNAWGQVIGHLAVLDVHPLAEGDPDLSILRLLAERAASELERIRLHEQLLQAQKFDALGELVGGLAHHFNNILTAIVGYSELMLQRFDPEDDKRGDCEQVLEAAKRGARLIDQLRVLNRRQLRQPHDVDLNELIGRNADMLRQLLGENVELSLELEPDLGAVKGNPVQLEQVLVNLVANARDAMPLGGRLRIATRGIELDEASPWLDLQMSAGPYAVLIVDDSGPGIDPTHLSRIFEPFFSTKPAGSGLGLATAYGIVRYSGGNLIAENLQRGGARLLTVLPQIHVSGPDGSEPESKAAAGRRTLLIVEEREDVRGMLERVLRRHGFQVLSARDRAAALDLAKTHEEEIDLLIGDFSAGAGNGWEWVQRWSEVRPESQVLHISGHAEDDEVRRAIAEGRVSFLKKPFSGPKLVAKVRELLNV